MVKVSLAILFLLLAFGGCSNKDRMASENETPKQIEEFWTWFVAHRSEFEAVTPKDSNDILITIGERLRTISDGLVAEMSPAAEGSRELTISAEGDRRKFPIVKEIVSKAPKLDGWVFTAFRQPAKKDFILTAEGIEYDTSKMFFVPLVEGKQFDLIVYTDNLDEKDEDRAFRFGMVVMDNFLGEYDAATKVRRYGFRDLNNLKDRSELRKLNELPKFIDEFHRNL